MADPLQIIVTDTQARQGVFAGQGSVLLENRSLTQTVYAGGDEGMDPADNTVFPIDPLGSKVVDGSEDVWLRTPDGSGTALVVAVPGGISSQVSPVLAAEQIALSGIATAVNQETTQTTLTSGIALPVGAAQEAGNLQTARQLLAGTSAGALLGVAGNTVAKEVAAWLAGGAVAATPGGVPLLANPNAYQATGTPLNVPAGTAGQVITVTGGLTLIPMGSYLSYEIHARTNSNSASTNPFFTYILTWYQDAAASIPLYRERWTFANNAVSGGTSIVGTGPVRGAYCQISATNEDATNAQTIQGLQVTFNARPCGSIAPDWRTYTPLNSIPAYQPPLFGNGDDNILAIYSATQPVSSVVSLVCGVFNGAVQFNIGVSAGTSPNLKVSFDTYVSGSGVQGLIPPITFTALGNQSLILYLPRSPLIVQLQNLSATNTVTYGLSVVASSLF